MRKNFLSMIAISLITISVLCVCIIKPVQAQYGPPAGTNFGPPPEALEQQQKALARLQKAASSMERAVNQFEKVVKAVQSTGYVVPADILSSLEGAKSAIQTIRSATEFSDAVESAIDTFSAFADVLDQNIENLAMLSKFPKILKGADRAMTTLNKNFDKAKSLLLAGVDFDVTEILAHVQAKIDALKGLYDKANTAAKAGKAEEAFTILQDEFFPGIEDASQSVGMLNAVRGLNRASIAMNRGFQSAQKIIDRLKKMKKNTSGLETILGNMKTKLEAFKAVIKTPGFDPENAVTILDEIDTLRTQFEDTLDGIVSEGDEVISGRIAPIKLFNGIAPSAPMEIRQGYDRASQQGAKALGIEGYGNDSLDMSGYDMSGGFDPGDYNIPEGYGPSGF